MNTVLLGVSGVVLVFGIIACFWFLKTSKPEEIRRRQMAVLVLAIAGTLMGFYFFEEVLRFIRTS